MIMKIALFFVVFSCFLEADAQQSTITYSGKTRFVYPYQQEMEIPMRNFRMGLRSEEVITRDSLNRSIVSTGVQPIRRLIPMENNKVFRKYKKVFLAIRSEHPGIIYTYNLPLEKDIVPTLEPLRDGDYVNTTGTFLT